MTVALNLNVPMKPLSPLALSIVDSVSSFIKANADAAAVSQAKLTTQDGADAMASAICYAIGKALSSSILNPAWIAATTSATPIPNPVMGPAVKAVTFEP